MRATAADLPEVLAFLNARAYVAIGFRKVGDWTLYLREEP